ncbi:MAG: ATP-dependent DNA helicase RecQ, partial [Bacteroidales bacterium]|nr:ATP-dependent DNA helicase RecQ [Bacteroidales bacterium]
MTAREILKEYWGYDSFRPLQEEIVASVLAGHDTLGMLPTGGGKSITFQVPGLVMGGLTLVITPLIALMKDQADHLVERGIKAAAIYMGMTRDEVAETYERVIGQHYNFLYVSPERLQTQMLLERLPYLDIRLLVVDEAHCISQWGYDFRPPYLHIADFRQRLAQIETSANVPCIALTATATPDVVRDICQKLSFRKGYEVHRASFVRPNLTYTVVRSDNPINELRTFLDKFRVVADAPEDTLQSATGSAIVYVRSRKKTQAVAESLTSLGIPSTFYHAGLTVQQKQERQEAWMLGQVPVVVATNAFGMGIDKPNVRVVIHLDL